MKDEQGRSYARMSELKAGEMVKVDADFDCLEPWSEHLVEIDNDGFLFIRCNGPDGANKAGAKSKHYLDGQLRYDENEDDSLVGIYKV